MTPTELNDLIDYARSKKLSLASVQVLNHLHVARQARINGICRACNISPPAMTSCSDSLVERGYITRRSGTADRRNIWLEITAKGDSLITNALLGPAIH